MRGMIWDMRLSNDSTATADGAAQFTLKPDDRQLLVMTFATDEVSSNALLYEIARHNFKSFVVKDFDLEQLNFGRLGMIVIRDFRNMDELNHYRSVMAASNEFKLPRGVRPVVISDDNFKLMLSQGRSFDEYFRFLQEQNYEDTQADLLQPDEVETLEEADESVGIPPTETEPEPDSEASEANVANVANSDEPEPAPVSPAAPAQPAQQPAAPANPAQPATQPAQKPQPAPVIVPQPARPTMPAYDPGSEGDDPLLE